MLQSTLESTLSQLNLTVSELEKMPKSLQPEEALFTGDGNEKNSTELAEQTPNCSSNVNNNSSPLKVPGCEEQLATNKFKLHPHLEQFHWARQLFAEAALLSDRTMTRPDAILDEHLTRVWPRRAREMTREDRIMDDSSQTQFGWPYRFRRRRGTCREPHSQPSQTSGVTAVVPQIPHYIEELSSSNVDSSPNTTHSQRQHLDHISDLSTVECSPEVNVDLPNSALRSSNYETGIVRYQRLQHLGYPHYHHHHFHQHHHYHHHRHHHFHHYHHQLMAQWQCENCPQQSYEMYLQTKNCTTGPTEGVTCPSIAPADNERSMEKSCQEFHEPQQLTQLPRTKTVDEVVFRENVAMPSEDEQQCNGSSSVTTSLSDFIDCEVYVSEQSQPFILGSSLIPRPNRAVSAPSIELPSTVVSRHESSSSRMTEISSLKYCGRSKSLTYLPCSLGSYAHPNLTNQKSISRTIPLMSVISKLPGHTMPHIAHWNGKSITLGEYKRLLFGKQEYLDGQLDHFRYFFKCYSNEFPPGLVYEEVQDDSAQIPLWDGRVWGKVEYC
ncbi:hypothetical protein D915_003733 [Fasciola hepatica]|uniref:DIX domain-containing protein n=1 Tax=Fasciola hepatica TaxID=6192 RepID=A0A4E0RHM3_FASHE|nr:hypothetical protein D915_003733 [Fasciola hepatica]